MLKAKTSSFFTWYILCLSTILRSSRARTSVLSGVLKVRINFYGPEGKNATSILPASITLPWFLGTSTKVVVHRNAIQRNVSALRAVATLAAAPAMRITPDLHRRSSKKSLHTFHFFLVPHFPISLHIFSKSPICVLMRIWTQTARNATVGGPYGF